MIKKFKSLKSHQGFVKYAKNTSWLFFERILRMLVGLFVGVWVARYLGPEQYGLFNYVVSFVGLFTIIATFGLDSIIIRELVKNSSRRDELIGTAFWLKFFGAFIVLLILAIAINFTSNDTYTNTLVFIIASATIFQSFNAIDLFFQSKVLSKYVVYVNVIGLFITSVIKIILILNEAPLIAFAWVILVDKVILAIGFIYFYIKKESIYAIKGLKFNKNTAMNLLKQSWPLILSSLLISIYTKIDQVMLKEIVSNEAVGLYAVAVRLSEIWYFIPIIISSSLFPAIINAKKQGEQFYYARLQKLYDLMIWTAIILAVFFTFISNTLVEHLYGLQYKQAGNVLIIYAWAGIFVFFGNAWGKWMINENLQKTVMKMQALSLIANIILNLILIPTYGIMGAAIATLVSYGIGHTVFALFFKNQKIAVVMFWKSFNPKRIINDL
ncbi:flippase [Sulfurovum sp. zt1-1]|uniref:Flippase n=1 Tax=Sulfurovum zhangzhouensis TaxID=3019067 RepID=A0ABT7R0V7_9BACT|nr:flippase [Sulfurovum zhangzhouensis]MDM5272409.1 flippase [Sulfurovum zhangzhouensis]